MPYFEARTKSGILAKFLIDTGSTKNYIQPSIVPKPIKNKVNFFAKSIAGDIEIKEHTHLQLFNADSKLKFYLLPSLRSFHGILGNDSLKELNAVINVKHDFMMINGNTRVKIKQLESKAENCTNTARGHSLIEPINTVNIERDHMSEEQENEIKKLVRKFPNLFTEPNDKLTYTTKVVGEIRTNTDTPVYTRAYPYPMSLKSEVEAQIKKMLDDGIIRPSRSPYNSPVWVVAKKPDSQGNKQYRIVIDYRKLNSVTISDRYPIPQINEVLSQLGKNQYFSVLDLKSGFHQIPLKESDIEKTAFSINNGKYEFTRLPFGLKNSPPIFQRALDDILRRHIGEICYVYIDDIVVFSKSQQEHIIHLNQIFKTLDDANMKVQLDKCHFFRNSVEFLGFIISSEGIMTNPAKVEAIAKLPYPENIKQLRSFLGLSGYYRRFIKDYAMLAKPLTILLRGEEGHISKNKSAKIKIVLKNEGKDAFNKIKNSLMSDDVILSYPDFTKEFHLTTDASNYAIGAVLSQDKKPIAFISRTLNKTEESYAANEKEFLAIIWALDTFRNYLYGTAKVKIFTDHQPLTHALSNKNNNAKMKRWKSILEEYNHELHYKPGATNVVADALSRIPEQINSISATQHSDESSSHNLIPSVETPINVFKNQIFLESGVTSTYKFQIVFPTYHRHIIEEPDYDSEKLVNLLKRYLNPSVTNCIKAEERVMGKIQEIYPTHFYCYRIRFTQLQTQDVTDKHEQDEIIIKTHKRAHRNCRENKIQILEKYYFPSMTKKINSIIEQCSVCKENKYDRRPNKPELGETPIPQYPGQILHIDIYMTDKNIVLTAIDKFSKYAQVKILKSRAIEHVKEPLRELLFQFGVPESVVIDNETSFNSASIKFMLEDILKIKIFKTPPYTSSVNGQVERFHSTMTEIMRCLKSERKFSSFAELLDNSVYEYNFTIHSTTKKRPLEVFFGRRISTDPSHFEKAREENIAALKSKQEKDLTYHNKKREPIRIYHPGEIVYVKINERLGTKISPKFKKETVKEDRNSTIVTQSGKIVHKSNIKHQKN